jgi:phosphatidylglycerol---prolipoprotein diacylglyceryl transferase
MHYVDNLDPIAFTLGPLAVRWYGLGYLAGLLVGAAIVKWLQQKERLLPPGRWLEDLVLYMVLGVIVGGRLGEVLLYQPAYYFRHPLEIFAVWHGGMASHGGMVGVAVATYLFARKRNISYWILMDAIALAAPPGLFFGRIANFINGELVGKVSDVPWAVVFPSTDAFPRHPVQIYQALTEGPLLFLCLLALPYPRYGYGSRAAAFCIGYGVVRIATEFFREPDPDYLGSTFGLTNGQLFSAVLVMAGVWLFLFQRRRS